MNLKFDCLSGSPLRKGILVIIPCFKVEVLYQISIDLEKVDVVLD